MAKPGDDTTAMTVEERRALAPGTSKAAECAGRFLMRPVNGAIDGRFVERGLHQTSSARPRGGVDGALRRLVVVDGAAIAAGRQPARQATD